MEMGEPSGEVVDLAMCGAHARMSKSLSFTHLRIHVLPSSNAGGIEFVCVGTATPQERENRNYTSKCTQ